MTGIAASTSQSRLQKVVKSIERLGNDVHIGENGHEVRVTIPAWNDVPVKMSGKSCTGDLPQVQTDVETIGRHDPADRDGQISHQLRAFQELGISQFSQFRFMGMGGNQKVPVVVRKTIEHDTACLTSQKDEVGAILVRMIPVVTQETSSRSWSIGGLDVAEPPGGPERVVRHGPRNCVQEGSDRTAVLLHERRFDCQCRKMASWPSLETADCRNTGRGPLMPHGQNRVGEWISGGETR